MTVQESLVRVTSALPEPRQREVLEFAEFLRWRVEQASHSEIGRAQLAQAYGDDEPEYTEADLKAGGRL